MIINPYVYGGSAPTDPFFANVTALLHMDGANGGTSFPDVIGTVWTPRGSASTSTAQKKFGTAAGNFTGSGNNPIQASDTAALRLGTSLFTIEGWFLPSAPINSFGMCYQKGVNSAGGITLGVTPTTVTLRCNGITDTNVTGLSISGWTHIAWVRDASNIVSIYVGGVRVFTGTVTFNQNETGTILQIGANDFSTGNSAFSYRGYIDEFRITKGVARYSGATIVVPSAAFPDS